jgi:hypothetical protein
MTANVSPEQIATAVPLHMHPKRPPEFIAAVIKAYNDGMSYSEIGIEFDLTRNQAAGILNRAGVLKKRTKGRKAYPARPKRGNQIVAPPKFRAVPFEERVAPVEPLNIPFLDRRLDQCSLIAVVTDPADQTCCGHPTYGSTSWCRAHAQIVFQPYQARHRAPRPR